MTITNVDKVGDHIRIVEDGITRFLTVVGEDIPVSVPTTGKCKVVNLYVDEATNKVYVAYHQAAWEAGSPTVIELSEAGVGAGDMLKSTYDTDEDGVVDNSEKLEGSTKAEVQDHTPKAHLLGAHTADTLANLNAKVSDATLDGSGDSRTPSAHKASHQNAGTDEISVAGLSGLLADDQHVLDAEVVAAAKTVKLDDFTAPDDTTDLDATDALHGLISKADKGKLDGIATGATVYPDTGEQAFLDADHTKLDNIEAGATVYPDTGEQAFLDADHSKLDAIEAGADVTDTTNVNAAVKRIVYVKVLANDTAVATGDGKAYITIPSDLNGMNLVDADIAVYTASSSGTPTVQLHNLDYAGGAQDMLSTLMTIDENELNSYIAATPPVINGSYDDVATGDRIRIDVDVAGTGTKGLDVILVFQTP